MDIVKQKNAYFLSHNGLGDNITSIGAVNFLLNYYENIFFLCKDIHEDNVKLLFNNKPVIIVAFDPSIRTPLKLDTMRLPAFSDSVKRSVRASCQRSLQPRPPFP